MSQHFAELPGIKLSYLLNSENLSMAEIQSFQNLDLGLSSVAIAVSIS